MQVGSTGFINVSKEKFNGKTVVCESFIDNKTGYTMKYYFDGETLIGIERIHPKKVDEIIYVEKVNNSVKDSMFTPPKIAVSLDEWLG